MVIFLIFVAAIALFVVYRLGYDVVGKAKELVNKVLGRNQPPSDPQPPVQPPAPPSSTGQ